MNFYRMTKSELVKHYIVTKAHQQCVVLGEFELKIALDLVSRPKCVLIDMCRAQHYLAEQNKKGA